MAISSAVYASILATSGRPWLPRGRDLRGFAAAGLAGMALTSALYAQGLHLTTASHSGLLYTLTPLLVFGLSHALGYLRLTRRDLGGLAIGLGGAALIIGAPALGGTEGGGVSLLGDLLTGASAVTWGTWTLLAAPLFRRYGTLRATAWLTATGAVGLFPLALPGLLAEDWRALPLATLAGYLYSGIVAGAAGGLLWYGAVRHLGAARTIVYANLESFSAVLFAALLLGELVEWTALAGGLAVIGGVLLTRRSGREQPVGPSASRVRGERRQDSPVA